MDNTEPAFGKHLDDILNALTSLEKSLGIILSSAEVTLENLQRISGHLEGTQPQEIPGVTRTGQTILFPASAKEIQAEDPSPEKPLNKAEPASSTSPD